MRAALPIACLWALARCATSGSETSASPDDRDVDAQAQAAAQAVADLERLPPPTPTPRDPLSEVEIAGLLQDADDDLHALGLRRKPGTSMRGPTPQDTGLRRAYRERRALNYAGTRAQVELWFSLAKFGTPDPESKRARGPLHPFDLYLVHGRGDRAWLHVVVPTYGFAPLDAVGDHRGFADDHVWALLSDRLAVGDEYVLYKRDGTQSVHHQWGRQSVIDDVVDIARTYYRQTGVPIGIGDISRIGGGKLPGHWTHKKGVDVDLYLLAYPRSVEPSSAKLVWHSLTHQGSIWSTEPDGAGEVEAALDDSGETRTAKRLRTLAEMALPNDQIVYFVHDDPNVLAPFDERAQARRAGRRFLHAHNRGYWPPHRDHVHLRWHFGRLVVDDPPRP